MIRKLIGITALYLSVSLCGLAQTERIVILHTNDVHGAIDKYAKVAALKNECYDRGASAVGCWMPVTSAKALPTSASARAQPPWT